MFTLRRNIVLAFGAAALLVGALLGSLWLRHVAATNPGAASRQFVMAATGDIRPGTLLRLEDMTWTAIEPTNQKKNLIVRGTANLEDYEGALARQQFRAGDPITSDGLLRSTDRNFLSAVLAPGTRALTLPIEAQQSSSGLVRPGDRVDVILTQNLGDAAPDPGHRVLAETLLRDIPVVAVERALTSTTAAQKSTGFSAAEPAIPKTITLEVSEEQAQKLLVAAQLGKVDLVERALVPGVTSPTFAVYNTWAYDVSPALGALRGKPVAQPSQSAQPTPPAASPSISGHGTIEVMHGSKLEIR